MKEPRGNKTSITDSPWYWLYLFATAGLVALVLMGPKFSARQAQIEQKYQGRQRAVQQVRGIEPSTPLSSQEDTAITLRPLYIAMGGLLALAWARLWWTQRRGRWESKETGPAITQASQ